MIDCNVSDRGMPEIQQLARGKIKNKGALVDTAVSKRLYVFGAKDTRNADIYISPDIPDGDRIVEFLTRVKINAVIRKVGNPAQKSWIALRRSYRLNNPEKCASVCVLVLLSLNNLIDW